MRRLMLVFLSCSLTFAASASPPSSSALAESSWPTFHRGPYAQASGNLPSLKAGDAVHVQVIDAAHGGTSPWTVFAKPYSDGSQAAFGSTRTGIVKHVFKNNLMRQVSYLDLPRQQLQFDWNLLALRSNEVLTTSKRENAFYIVGDAKQDCPSCKLVVKKIIRVPLSVGKILVQFQLSYDGTLIALLEGNRLAAISLQSGKVLATHSLGLSESDISFHNAFPADEYGRIYLASQEKVSAVDWRNGKFYPAWQANYDFRGPGCDRKVRSRLREAIQVARGERCTGSGTTPTLIGTPESGLVVMVDGHAPRNRLVGLWRGTIPSDWIGLPGYDRRIAAILPLPLSTPEGEGFTAENSPAAIGNAIFIAQWAGFRADCSPPKGVQRVDWLPADRRFDLIWANPNTHFNGVASASSLTGLVYGSGRGEGCTYHYRGLDIATGKLMLDIPLGEDDRFQDQGNQQSIADDGSILVAVKEGLMRLSRR